MPAHRDPLTASAALRKVLVLGGARSGKSAFAERLAAECRPPVLYVATATVDDHEMAERIARHRAQRPAGWRTLEVQRDLAVAVQEQRGARTIVVEDLTLALSNLIEEQDAEQRLTQDVAALVQLDMNLVLVSNEVGMGLVPPYPLGRSFRDALGRVNQHAAALSSEVYLLVAGLPLRLK